MFVAFYRGQGIVDMLIRLWTRGPYAHCELIFSDGARHSAEPGIGTIWMPRLEMTDSVPAPRADWDVLPVEGDEARAREWCDEHVGECYDWFGIVFSQIMPVKSQANDKYWCSEAIVEALQFAYCDKLAQVDSRMSNPNNLYKALL